MGDVVIISTVNGNRYGIFDTLKGYVPKYEGSQDALSGSASFGSVEYERENNNGVQN